MPRHHLAVAALVLVLAACASPKTEVDPWSMDAVAFSEAFQARFNYPPPQPKPKELLEQNAGQAADAEYLLSFADYDKSYSPEARVEARAKLQELRAAAGSLSHDEFILRVSEITALADNAH